MNDTIFKNLLSQIAQWYTPIVNEYSHMKKPAVNASAETINTTLGPVIESLNLVPSDCQWCGKIVNQEINYQRIVPRRTDKDEWIARCTTCNMYKNPVTDAMQRHFPTEVPTIRKWTTKQRAAHQRKQQNSP